MRAEQTMMSIHLVVTVPLMTSVRSNVVTDTTWLSLWPIRMATHIFCSRTVMMATTMVVMDVGLDASLKLTQIRLGCILNQGGTA